LLHGGALMESVAEHALIARAKEGDRVSQRLPDAALLPRGYRLRLAIWSEHGIGALLAAQ
jgi:hypothetical protein